MNERSSLQKYNVAKLTGLRPLFWVTDVRATIDWYVQTLSFTETAYNPAWQWGEVTRDEVSLMFAKPNEHTPFNGSLFTGSFYFNTNGVEAWWERLKDSPCVYYGLENFDYGMREFAIKDCNGFILQFGQERVDEENH